MFLLHGVQDTWNLRKKLVNLAGTGGGSFWGLCQFAGVDTLGCAGPHKKYGVSRALIEVAERLKEMEEALRHCTASSMAAVAQCYTKKRCYPCST